MHIMSKSKEYIEIAKTIRYAAMQLHSNGPHDGYSIVAAAELWKISNDILSYKHRVVADDGSCDGDRIRQASVGALTT
jgi:hypothetical protein